MSAHPCNNDEWDFQEAAAEEEVLKIEEEVRQMTEKILQYRATLPDQLSSTLSSLLATQRPVFRTHLVDQEPEAVAKMLPSPDSEAGIGQGLVRSPESEEMEAEKIGLLHRKISSNAWMLPVVMKRMEEYMAKFNELALADGFIHPAFERKWIG